MGAIGDAMAEYVEPLLEGTDGSMEQAQKAFMIGQVCWNLAISPEDAREKMLDEFQKAFGLSEEDFQDLKTDVIAPMIVRHYALFPKLHEPKAGLNAPRRVVSPEGHAPAFGRGEKYPGTGRNALCPCNSGKKYKRCCGRLG